MYKKQQETRKKLACVHSRTFCARGWLICVCLVFCLNIKKKDTVSFVASDKTTQRYPGWLALPENKPAPETERVSCLSMAANLSLQREDLY